MSSISLIGWQPLSDTGTILSGAKAYFYKTGTTNAKNTYSDKALTLANANPVVADAAGRFGPIFLLKDEGYRVKLQTSGGVDIYTKDEVFADSFAVDEAARRLSVVRSPMDHGAVGDGAADDTTAVQAAITATSATVDLEGKTYKCTGTVTVPSGVTIRNGKLVFTSAAATPITITGTRGAADNLSANAAGGNNTAQVTSGAGFASLDLVYIRSSSVAWGANTLGQLEYVKTVAGTTLTFSSARGVGIGGALLGAYNTADSARVEKLTPITDVRFEDVSIEAQAASATILTLTICERISIRNCRFLMAATCTGVKMVSCASVSVGGCHFVPSSTTAPTYGVLIQEASRDITVADCRFRRLTKAMDVGASGTVGGVCRYVVIRDCTAELIDNAVHLDNGSKDIAISGCMFNGGTGTGTNTDLIDIEGYDVSVSGCQINDPVRHWVRIHPKDNIAETSDSYEAYSVSDCMFSGAGNSTGSMIIVDPVTAANDPTNGAKVSITGNTFGGGEQLADAILIGSTAADGVFQSVVISGNAFGALFVSATDYLVHVKCHHATSVVVSNNSTYTTTAASGVFVEIGVDDVVIANNLIAQQGIGVYVSDVSRAVISGNDLPNCTTGIQCLYASATINAELVIAGNKIVCTGEGITLSVAPSAAGPTIGRAAITGNTVTSSTTSATVYCLRLVTATTGTIADVAIVGNAFSRGNDAGPNVYVNGAGGAISEVVAVGNVLNNGTYGFSLVHVVDFHYSHNAFDGLNTGQVTGTFTKDGSKGFIPLDITTVKIIAANVIGNLTEGMLPDGNSDPSLQRVNAATDKALRLIWGAGSLVEVQFASFAYPPDLDDNEAVVVNLMAAMSGAVDTPTIGVAYFEGIGSADLGGATGALGSSLAQVSRTIAGANVGPYPKFATVGLTPAAHATDSIRLYAAWVEYRKNHAMNAT